MPVEEEGGERPRVRQRAQASMTCATLLFEALSNFQGADVLVHFAKWKIASFNSLGAQDTIRARPSGVKREPVSPSKPSPGFGLPEKIRRRKRITRIFLCLWSRAFWGAREPYRLRLFVPLVEGFWGARGPYSLGHFVPLVEGFWGARGPYRLGLFGGACLVGTDPWSCGLLFRVPFAEVVPLLRGLFGTSL
ncbi:uncharacterized protein G2W53_027251 [Senna tora]|uniref:Uncharacterized protein n=1 Tax=Senna tora TaxID=362788 RepID=A0A834WJN9_9FABA|nr:uncharacterized protein G2W53_027251 [Senna tora]